MKTVAIAGSFVVTLVVAAQPKPLILTDADNGKELTVKGGGTFKVSLKTNPTTGYQLHFLSRGNEPWTLVSQSYKQDPASPRMAGVGGVETFTFRAKSQGTAKLTFVSVRSFAVKESLSTAEPWQVTIKVK